LYRLESLYGLSARSLRASWQKKHNL